MANIFADHLGVTYHPDNSQLHSLRLWLIGQGAESRYDDPDGGCLLILGSGTIKLVERSRFHKIGFSGSALGELRSRSLYDETLSRLSDAPHTVTRLDVALDIPTDAPGVLRDLESRYPDDRVTITRKAVKVTRLYSARESDQQLTGSWYAGKRGSTKVLLRVYDKAQEMKDRLGVDYPPTTRFEFEVSKEQGATLRDAAAPDSLFWHLASPRILPAPAEVPDWVSGSEFTAWQSSRTEKLPTASLRSLIERSGVFDDLQLLADEVGSEGVTMALRLIEKRLRAESVTDGDTPAQNVG